ncbi:hypothetical protein C8J57DRAFT_1724580 [Mycena rebaudengoi]|nr:hypothetical protein C8J57DRAFT_1724580 [Mycena rebaudengoi]
MFSTSPRSLLPLNTGGLDLPTFAWDHQVYRYIFVSAAVILIYDHLLTLELEVKWVWLPRHRLATYWFFLIRYMAIVATATYATFYFGDFLPESCSKIEIALECLLCIQEVLVVVTLGLRVFAMYGSDLRVLALMTVPGAAAGALSIWTIAGFHYPVMLTAPGFTGCHTVVEKSTSHRLASAWLGQLVCDLFVLVLTLRRAYVDRDVALMMGDSLATVMARDGAMYFGIIVLTNLANVLTIHLGDILLSGILCWFNTALSTSLLCRLMLNLHEAAHIEGRSQIRENSDSTQLESLHFVQDGRPQIRTVDRDDASV